jgi:hypothetical protein
LGASLHGRPLGAGNIEKRGDIHISRDHPARVGRRIGRGLLFPPAKAGSVGSTCWSSYE